MACHIHLMPDGSVRFSEGPDPQDGNYTTLRAPDRAAAQRSADLLVRITGLPLIVHPEAREADQPDAP